MARAAAGVAKHLSKGFTLMALLPFYVALECTSIIDHVTGIANRP